MLLYYAMIVCLSIAIAIKRKVLPLTAQFSEESIDLTRQELHQVKKSSMQKIILYGTLLVVLISFISVSRLK